MLTRRLLAVMLVAAAAAVTPGLLTGSAEAAGEGQPSDWQRYYYYPYVYYPHNFQPQTTYDNMYHRYPADRRIPVYNKDWHNFYPSPRPYHKGNHFILDVF
ncbi:MAG: hypothetical protein KDA79_08960 [Planctomycetaceae bacterium]|nr:hypothetical protein [Planctomycetaceae bacterium]